MSIGILKNVFINLDSSTFKHLYTALIRPHLENAERIWSSNSRQDIIKLENFRRRAAKMVKSLKNLSYEQHVRVTELRDNELA